LWVALFYVNVWYTIANCAFEVHEENRGWQNEGIMGDSILGNRDRNKSLKPSYLQYISREKIRPYDSIILK